MLIYTGCYRNIDKYVYDGLKCVAISATIPTWYNVDNINYYWYPWLSPTVDILSKWNKGYIKQEDFINLYMEHVLNKYGVDYVLNKLYNIAKDCILLCYEPPGKFCHRHIIAYWLSSKCDINVVEYN